MDTENYWLKTIEPGSPDRIEVYQFRYNTYVVENGKKTESINHRDRVLIDAIDDGTFLITCRDDNEIVGTISLRFGTHQSKLFDHLYKGYFERIDSDRVAYVSRLMVASSNPCRRQIAESLISTAFWKSVDRNMRIGLMHCEKPMIRYFRRWGFLPYGSSFDAGFSATQFPMAIATANECLFRKIGSPLIDSGRQFPSDSGEVALFRELTSNQQNQKVAANE